jgi:hypothetical protein
MASGREHTINSRIVTGGHSDKRERLIESAFMKQATSAVDRFISDSILVFLYCTPSFVNGPQLPAAM